MSVKADAEQIEDFALVEIGRRPNRHDAVNGRVETFDHHMQANPLFQLVGEDVVRDLETRLGRIPVDHVTSSKKLYPARCRVRQAAREGLGVR